MREIKFRAWSESKKAMYRVLGYSDIEQCFFVQGKGRGKAPLADIVLMQYTGLKDKNGKEICEGDIVSFEDSDGGYEYPDLVVNTGIVEYGKLGFYFTNRVAVEMDDFYIKDGRCDDIEVLGNIYENPELMA
jgi:uncharacterized phage protein (TIGR01671 family)